MKRCKVCTIELTKENTYSHHSKCKECSKQHQKEYYKENKEWSNEYSRQYSKTHREQDKLYQRKYRNKARDGFLAMYGNACSCCGETNKEFLTIEHIKGQVGVENKEMGAFAYKKATKEYRPDLYETLCYNCNMSKGRYGYCPHKNQSL